jgi:hypothetical protein
VSFPTRSDATLFLNVFHRQKFCGDTSGKKTTVKRPQKAAGKRSGFFVRKVRGFSPQRFGGVLFFGPDRRKVWEKLGGLRLKKIGAGFVEGSTT